MRKRGWVALCSLLVMAGMTSCITSIRTVVPTTERVVPVKTVYTTQVTTPAPKQTTITTVRVTNYSSDMSFYLDLNAVAAAYAESNSIREFEQLLNSSRYMINNLDLNRDGWVDYLRVIETRRGYYYASLIQACLAPGVFQDVATLVAERRADRLYVEVIGDPYLYGYNYIVRPVFIKRPPMWTVYGEPSYAVWSSPYYWGNYPSYYTQPQPVYLNHYQAYVTTYMSHHPYCNRCDYPDQPFYDGYTSMTQSHRRNDYYAQHPDQSFERRVGNTIQANTGTGRSVRNSGQLRSEVLKEAQKTEPKKTSTASTTSTSSSSRASSTTKTATTTTGGSVRGTSSTTRATKTVQPTTSVETKVKKSGTTRTTIKQTDSTGRTTTVKRESTSNATRKSSTSSSSSSSRKSSTSSSSSSSRSSQASETESSPRSVRSSR